LNARGVAVPFWQDGKRINILVFRHEMRMGRFIRLTASRLDDPTELSGSVHSKEVDVMIPLDPPPAAAAASAAAAACVPVQAGPTCRLARIDLPADQEGRVKTTYFSLNFAEVAKREDKDASIKIQFQ
jgi:hypothetical protein